MPSFWTFCQLFHLIIVLAFAGNPGHKPNVRAKGDVLLGPCQSCRTLVNSMHNALARLNNESATNRNTTTESPNYDNPEGHLAKGKAFQEILKTLCTDVTTGKAQCIELIVRHSDHLENWVNHLQPQGTELFNWFCIEKLEVCCPVNHYGPNCTPCPGYPGDVCSGHGKCKGNGTRKGNGGCACDKGYIGAMCNDCAKMHFEAYRDDNKVLCSACHKSCQNSCSGAGPKNCESCNEGWEMDDDGCYDINECLMLETPCDKNEFCVNTEGSYSCFDCDRSCDGCSGDGPDMCDKCAEGYTLIEKFCIDKNANFREQKVDVARYLTYCGLCVSTCIIFQKNPWIASLIGVAVGVYIATSEYLLNAG